jgi:Domain of unknown function (DUF6265)
MKKFSKMFGSACTPVFPILFLLVFSACAPRIAKFGWLAGDWEMLRKKGGVLVESWKLTDAKSMQGRTLRIVAQDTTPQESVQLYYKNKHFWYVPTVPDQNEAKPVAFKLIDARAGTFVFENPQHDFPQRIIYRFCPLSGKSLSTFSTGDTLRARVESLQGKGMDYTYLRKRDAD